MPGLVTQVSVREPAFGRALVVTCDRDKVEQAGWGTTEVGTVLHIYPAPVSKFTHVLDSIYRGTRWGLLAYELVKLPLHWRALRHAIRVSGARVVHLNESELAAASIIAKQMGCREEADNRSLGADSDGYQSSATQKGRIASLQTGGCPPMILAV